MLRYLTGKIDGTLATKMTKDAFAPKTPDTKTKARTVRMWACDVCQKAFPDYDEACRHEDQCRRLDRQAAQEWKKATSTTTHTKVLSSQSQDPVHIHPSPEPPPTHRSPEWSCDVCQKQFSDYDEACRHERLCQKDKKEEKALPKTVHPFFQKDNKKQDNKSRKPVRAALQQQIISIDTSPEPLQEASKKRKQAKQQKEPPKKMKPEPPVEANKQVSKKNPPLAGIFSGSGADQILAEHRAAEFAAKRRAQADRERERQKRRQTHAQEKKKAATTAKPSFESSTLVIKNKPRYPPAVRFPAPSHVGVVEPCGVVLAESRTAHVEEEALSKAQECLCKTPRHAGSEKLEQPSECSGLLPTDDKPIDEMEPLQAALADLLIPPEEASDGTVAWCDKYTIQNVPEDVCGEANCETAKELVKFVKEWKVERQRAHERRAEKQRALVKSKKQKFRKYRDDDLWDDSDDEDGGLCSVCLLTGPTGSGKTSLVHAIAAKSDCVVLEINTTEKRGGTALKNAIEEATQSDSSLDMLKKSQIACNADPFEDSDDEKETTGKGSSIIVILIDEVDIMYEEEGDAGFWSALSSLTKKAKCPIFLTANVVPDALLSSTIRYRHLETALPRPKDCVSKMRRIIENEGFGRLNTFADLSAGDKQLALIAELCKCDLRRIINELQLYANGPPLPQTDGDANMEITPDEMTCDTTTDYATPIITDISPKQVSPHDLSLLTITGKYFTSFRATDCSDNLLQVSIGNQLCPAVQLLNDSTVLAVCPSFLPPLGVNDFGVIERTAQESRTCRFAAVSIRFYGSFGLISSKSTIDLCAGASIASLGQRWNIEYAFPPPRHGILDYAQSHAADNNDDEGVVEEFERDPTSSAKLHSRVASRPRAKRKYVKKEAAMILEEGVRAWNSDHYERMESDNDCPRKSPPDIDSLRKLQVWSSQAQLASDAAMLEDAFELGGIPFLAGEVPGFGASLINDVAGNNTEGNEKRLLRDANARPPSFERLVSLGWNEDGFFFGESDTFVANPSDSRERKLLALTESLERGLSRPLATGLPSLDPLIDEECHNTCGSESTLSDSIKLHKASRRISEEDQFIRPPCASAMLSLPCLLRGHMRDARFNPIRHGDLARLPTAMQNKACQQAKLLSDLLEGDSDASSNRLICSAERLTEVSAAPLHERMDSDVFLDYLPLLRNMAVHERSAEHAFQKVCASDPESAAALSGRRRTTRRGGRQLERKHYFVAVGSCKENSLANELGSKLADELLHYSN